LIPNGTNTHSEQAYVILIAYYTTLLN